MKQHTSKVYGVWFYYLPPDQKIFDDVDDAFPPDNARLVEFMQVKLKTDYSPLRVYLEILEATGGNVIAVGRGDHFDIYDYREEK